MRLPKRDVVYPKALAGTTNGKLAAGVLVDVPGLAGGPVVRLVAPAARAWVALTEAASAAGVTLQATSAADSFRPYAVQERIFKDRYTTTHLAGRPTKKWQGRTYWQKPNTAVAAVPGTSNHGWALAVDTRTPQGGMGGKALDWLLDHALDYGFSWELDSEPWHIRYFAGDNPPAAVTNTPPATSEEDEMPVIPIGAKPTNGRWPAFDLVDVSDHACTVIASAGAPFAAGLDKFASPKFTYKPAAYGLSVLRVENLPGRPRLVPAPDGSVVLVTTGDLATFTISPPK